MRPVLAERAATGVAAPWARKGASKIAPSLRVPGARLTAMLPAPPLRRRIASGLEAEFPLALPSAAPSRALPGPAFILP